MNYYIYQADTYCEECINKTKEILKLQNDTPPNPQDETTYDSDDYPKGPYNAHYQEVDYPMHCAHCELFLENKLTTDGYNCVKEVISARPDGECAQLWSKFYNIKDN